MQTLPFDVLDAPDPFPDFINLFDDQEDGDPKGATQVLASATPLAEKECVLSPQHGGYDGQVQTTSSGKPLPPQHGGCAQPEIPHQHGGCAQPEAAFVGKPLPPQHGGSDGQPGQAPSGKSLPDQPEQQGGCDGHTKPLPPQHGGPSDGAPVGKPLPQRKQAPSNKPDLQHDGRAQAENPCQHGGCAQQLEQAKPLPPQHGGWDGRPGQAPSGTALPHGVPEQPQVRAAPSGHSCPLQADPPNMGIPSQAQTELSDGKGKVGTYDMEKLEDAQAQGSSNLSSHLFIF